MKNVILSAVHRPHFLASLLALALTACPGSSDDGDTGNATDPSSTGPSATDTSTDPPSTSSGSVNDETGSSGGATTSGGTTSGSSGGGSTDDGMDDAGVVPKAEIPCGNTVYECGDMLDNDGDGYFDLFDLECTGPCDDDESSFQTGLPGDNVDCIQDCFFDGNSGQGESCFWDLTCDPANPGANIGCEYDMSMACDVLPHDPEGCAAECEPLVPPGCDCFGCCTIDLGGGMTVDIFLNSDPACSIDNLDACEMCTSQAEECGNPCMPEECELCFGQSESDLPEGCGDNVCDNGMPCELNEDCPIDFFCFSDCCYPPPPG